MHATDPGSAGVRPLSAGARSVLRPGRRLVIAVALLLAIALAGIPLPAAAGPSLDEQVRTVASRLRCPVCQNESVADSPSALAAQMRELIRARLAQGEAPEAIVAYFVSRYGEWILLEPPRRGWGWVLWLAPGVLLAGGLLLLARYLRGAVRAGEVDNYGQGVSDG